MSSLKKSLFGVALYLSLVIVLGLLDLDNMPVINFASYFYVASIIVLPLMIVVPSLHKASVYWPMLFWGAVYFGIGRIVDRSQTGSTELSIMVLEFALFEVGTWLYYQLAVAIAQSESVVDILAQGTYPNRALDLDTASDRIKMELGRSRRYHRQLSLLVVQTSPEDFATVEDALKGFQHDLSSRLDLAKVAQAITESIRQTDLLMRDRLGRFIILCPETSSDQILLLGERIKVTIEQRTRHVVKFATALFPDDAVTFEDLLQVARQRLSMCRVAKTPEQKERVY